MSIINSLSLLIKQKTKEFSWSDIPNTNVIDTVQPETTFKADDSYFEIVIHTIYLMNQREYWIKYQPLGVTLTQAIYGESREEIPFVIGPQMLGKLEQIRDGDHITYRNIRVAGPQPYMGDWVRLFTGLWRSPVKNFAGELISFAETIGSAIQTPQLSACLAVAKPLVSGLETLLNINKLDLRVGYLVGFPPPPGPTSFRPGYFAMVRCPRIDKKKFWIKQDCLYFGRKANSAQPYIDSDYMLFSIKHLDKREDITTFPFYTYYKQAIKKVYSKKDSEANALLERFLTELAGSPDFTTRHRWGLVQFYKWALEKEKQVRDSKEKQLSADEISANVRETTLALTARMMEVSKQAGFPKTSVSSMAFTNDLIEGELKPILTSGKRAGRSYDKLTARVMEQVPHIKGYDPQKLAITLNDVNLAG